MHTYRMVRGSGESISEDWQESQYWNQFYQLGLPCAQTGILCMVIPVVIILAQIQEEKWILHKKFTKNHSHPYSVFSLL